MNSAPKLAVAVLAACALAACSPGTQVNVSYGVTFRNGNLVLHAPNRPDVYITATGTLRIGPHAFNVTPSEQTSLKNYYSDSRAVVAASKSAGTTGAQLLGHGIVDTIKGFLSSGSAHTDAKFDAKAKAASAALSELCADIQQLHDAQQNLAAQMPVFAPYAAANKVHCTISNITTHSITVANGGPVSTTTSKTQSTPKSSGA